MDSLGANGLLLNSSTRSQLLPLLRQDEALRLCVALGIGESQDPYLNWLLLSSARICARIRALQLFELPPPAPDTVEVEPSATHVPGGYPLFEHQRVLRGKF